MLKAFLGKDFGRRFLSLFLALMLSLTIAASFSLGYPDKSSADDYYVLTLTREDTNWYKVEYTYNPTYYIKTMYCYEYVYYEDCIWDPDGGWTLYGRIMINDEWYDIEGIYAKY